jgi:hypothetical protein
VDVLCEMLDHLFTCVPENSFTDVANISEATGSAVWRRWKLGLSSIPTGLPDPASAASCRKENLKIQGLIGTKCSPIRSDFRKHVFAYLHVTRALSQGLRIAIHHKILQSIWVSYTTPLISLSCCSTVQDQTISSTQVA